HVGALVPRQADQVEPADRLLHARRAPLRKQALHQEPSISARCSTLARSSASSLAAAANQASRISRSSASEVERRLSARTFASFQCRAPAAVAASAQSAARMPGTLFAAIEAPVPVQQQTIACWARLSATSRAAASLAQAQSSRS